MAKAILMRGGPGGVGSDEVTARREHVVKGHITITADSNDEIVEGLIEDRGEGAVAAFAIGREDWNHQIWATFRNGWYHRAPHPEGHESYIYIKYEALANLLGVDTSKMLESLTVADRRGQIPSRPNATASIEIVNIHWENPPKIGFRFPQGYYQNVGQYQPLAFVNYEKLADAISLRANKMLDDTTVLGVRGAIPQWTSPSHVVSAVNNEGFVWDDDTGANRGRGIVSKIPTGHYIQNASFVFLPSGNLYPQNVVKGININGVTGTRDWADRTNEYVINSNVSVSQLQNNQPIALGNAFSGSETLFIGVDLVGVDVDSGFVRRDKGNGRRNIGRMPLGKNDSNFVATFIRRCPVQVEITRDWAGNMSFILHIPYDWGFGQTQFYVYVYGHSSMQNNF